MLLVILAVISYFKEFKYCSSIEMAMLAVIYGFKMSDIGVTFPLFQMLKTLMSSMFLTSEKEEMSFCIFIYEIQVTPPSKSLLLRYPHNSVHAGIGVGDNTYHSSYPYGNANSQQRSSNLVASKSNYKL